MKRNHGIGKFFILIFIFFLGVPLVTVAVLFLGTVYETNRDKISRDIEGLTYAISSKVNTRLEVPAKYIMTVADLLDNNAKSTNIDSLLTYGVKNYQIFNAIYVLDESKKIEKVAFNSFAKYLPEDFIGITLSDVKKFENFNYYWSSPFNSLITNDYTVRLTVGYPEGYVVADISLKFLAESLIKNNVMEKTIIFIVDERGDVVASSKNIELCVHRNLFTHPLVNEGFNGGHVLIGYEWDRVVKMGASYRTPITGWFLVLEQEQAEAFKFFSEILRIAIISSFFILFFILIVLHFIKRKLIEPIRTLTDHSEKISKGVYSDFSDEEKSVFVELKTLYDSFENMSDKIISRERDLKEKEEYIRSIFDSTTNTGILVFNAEGDTQLTDANIGAQLILGYKLSEMIGFHPAGFIKAGGEDIERLQRDAVTRKSMTTGRFDMIKKSGIVFPVLCTVHPLVDSSGNVELFIVVFVDITEIKRVQGALEGEKERLDVTLKSIGEGVVATDKRGRISLINSSAESILGQKSRFIIGHNINEVIRIYDFETGEELVDELMKYEFGSKRTFRANIVSKQSGIITVTLTASGMLSNKGDVIGFVYVFRDITESIKLEQELLRSKVQLEEINKNLELRVSEETGKRRKNEQLLFEQAKFAAMGQMISAIAHQWRQPLNALALYTQDIEEAFEHNEIDSAYLQKFVESSMKLITHMSGTIDDFRNFFHSSNVRESVSMVKVVAESLSLIATQLKNQNISYEITIKANGKDDVYVNSLPPHDMVFGDDIVIISSEMKQVLLNILQNARDAISEKSLGAVKISGNIYISIEYSREKIVTKISNDGGCIPEDTLGNIFDPYYTTKPEGEGTGIGLYMSKVMVEDHMGGLLMAGNIDKGAQFTITLYYNR